MVILSTVQLHTYLVAPNLKTIHDIEWWLHPHYLHRLMQQFAKREVLLQRYALEQKL